MDVIFYRKKLFSKDIFTKVGWIRPSRTLSTVEELYMAHAQELIMLCARQPC
jgi:PHS family inorganic phosphate transporter-like MFS transporter